jgi:acetyl esterase
VTVHPQAAALLERVAARGGPTARELGVDELRALFVDWGALADPGPDLAAVEDRTFPGPAGDVPVRIYRPPPASDEPQPALVWFHGGGWIMGDIAVLDRVVRALAQRSGVVVVSVEYRLAPEHPFPAGLDDCHAALEWVAANADPLGIDAARLAVGGDSAGGNLAAVTALAARDRGGPPLRFQLLVYPVIDSLFTYPSLRENGEGYLLTEDSIRWFADLYLGEHHEHGDPKDPRVSPIYADDLTGLPPALVISAEYDPLRDENEAYGLRLRQAGVDVQISRYDGMIHGFFLMSSLIDTAHEAIDEAAAALREALREAPT